MKQLLLAAGVSLVIAVPTVASAHYYSDPTFHKEFFNSNPITGKVTDEKGAPLAGVTVQVKGLKTSTVTNVEGTFTINAPEGASTLVFTYVGSERQEVSIAGKTSFQIKMKSIDNTLENVVVNVGYGTQKKGEATGAVVNVDMKKIEDLPVRTITEALRGQVPGLNVNGGNARPGVNATLSIRQGYGFSKDGFSALPLVVIDDVIQLDPNTGQPSMDQFNALDMSEVESITVLKDAAAAIYGSRASEGAIVVKTKRGKSGPPRITYSGKFETNDAVSQVKTMSAYEYGIFANRFGRTQGWNSNQFFDSTELEAMKGLDYDWRREGWKRAGAMQHNVNVSGGADRATYFAGVSYFTQGANMGSQDYNRWTFRAGSDIKVANNLKLSATLGANNFGLEKSFTKVSLNDGSYTSGSEQTDYTVLSHMPKYIPWMYTVNGMNQFVSPALGPNRVVGTTPAGQNNIGGWNYYGLLNNGSKTSTGNFSYNTNFTVQYDVPWVKGLALKASYGLTYSTDNTEQNMLAQPLALATNTNAAGHHLYNDSTTWVTANNLQGTRVSYADVIGKIQQENFFVTYDNSFGLHSVSAMASVERGEQDYQKKFMIYDAPIPNAYNGSSPSAGTLNVSNSYFNRTKGGSLSYLGRVNYAYAGKYLLTFQIRTDASTKFAPENYWGVFPSLSAGWVVSKEDWFRSNVSWVDNLKLRSSIGKTGMDNLKAWRWMQTFTFASDKGMQFGTNGGLLGYGVTPDATPNRDVRWDETIQHNYGIDVSVLKNRLSFTVDHYVNNAHNMFTQMAGMIGVPISVGGAFAEQNYTDMRMWGTEISATWKDRVGQVDYSIGMNFGRSDNKVTKYIPAPFNYPSQYGTMEGMSMFRPTYGYVTWKGNEGGDGLLRTDADVDAYWAYLTDLATKAGTTPSYFGLTTKSAIKKGMLAYEDQAGALDATNKTIGGKNGRIETTGEDVVPLNKANSSYGISTNLGASWKGVSLTAQIATSWGGFNKIDYVKQGTSSGQILWAHESYLKDMYDSVDNVNGKYPSLGYYTQNGVTSDFWQLPTFRCFVRSMTLGYTLPKQLSQKMRMENVRVTLSGFNLWDFYNPYPDHYRNMYDGPIVDYPTLRTYSAAINVTF